MLGGKKKHVPDATRIIPDPRAIHYWDEPGATIRGYTKTLNLPEPAWDIYMIYGPEAKWEGDVPPKPAYWMHQLGSKGKERVDRPYLDPGVFAKKLGEMLATKRIESKETTKRAVTVEVPHKNLSPDLAELRDSFNAHSSQTRVLTLLSPS